MKFALTLSLVLFLANTGLSQLVNVESQRIQSDSLRRAGNANLTFSYQENNNKSLIQFKTSVVYQWKTKSLKDLFLILGNYNFSQTKGQKLSNAAFAHVRYNRKFSELVRYEAYSQIQYNELLNLRSRTILGTGLRFKFSAKKVFKSYIGIAGFYEYEENVETSRQFVNDFRMSNYLVLSAVFPKSKGEFTSTTYYQPKFDQFNDFRISNQTIFVINLTDRVAFTSSFSYFFDRFPPAGIAQETISFDNGIRVKF